MLRQLSGGARERRQLGGRARLLCSTQLLQHQLKEPAAVRRRAPGEQGRREHTCASRAPTLAARLAVAPVLKLQVIGPASASPAPSPFIRANAGLLAAHAALGCGGIAANGTI